MVFDKLFIFSCLHFLFAFFSIKCMSETEEILSTTRTVDESEISTLGNLTQVKPNCSCSTEKLQVSLKKIKDPMTKFLLTISHRLSTNTSLASIEIDEPNTPQIFISNNNHVILQRVDPQTQKVRFNVKQLIKKQIATKKSISGWRCTIL